MRSIFTCTIAALILTACSQTSITSTPLPEFTPTPESTLTPRPTETETPSATPTETNTPVPTAETAAIALFDKYGVAPDTYTLAEVDGVIVGTDNETGTEIFRDGGFEISYAVELAKKDCEPTNIEPQKGGSLVQQKDQDLLSSYVDALSNKYIPSSNYYFFAYVLVDREKQCWGFSDGDVLVYRNEDGLVRIVPTIHLTEDEVFTFILNR